MPIEFIVKMRYEMLILAISLVKADTGRVTYNDLPKIFKLQDDLWKSINERF